MSDLNVEEILAKLKLKKSNVDGIFHCKREKSEGLLLITTTKLIFAYLINNNLVMDEFLVFSISEIHAHIETAGGSLEFEYNSFDNKFVFEDRVEALKVKNIVKSKLPNKIKEKFGTIQINPDKAREIKANVTKLHKSVKVSNKFLKLTSEQNVKFEPGQKYPSQIKTTTDLKPVKQEIKKTATASIPTKKPEVTEKIYAKFQDYNKNVKVSEKLLAASVNIPYSVAYEASRKKPLIPPRLRQYLSVSNLVMIILLIIFIKSPYLQPTLDYLKVLPVKINYAFNFLKVQKCELQLNQIKQLIIWNYQKNRNLPTDFSDFLRHYLKSEVVKDTSKDPWGNTFEMEVDDTAITVRSIGVDGHRDSYDDLKLTFSLTEIELED